MTSERQEQALLGLLHQRRLLLVVDNADTLREDAGFRAFLGKLDPGGAGCLLLTSRRDMDVEGEAAVPLGRLSSDASAALFYYGWGEYASAGQLDEVTAICGRQLLDGHPLAIVLAAAVARKERLRTLSSLIERLRTRMVEVLRDRKPAREEDSLEASLGLSYDALIPAGREVLSRASIFDRPFRLEAMEAVAGDVAGWRDACTDLMDHHLLDKGQAKTTKGETLDVFSLHPVVKAYGLEKVSDLKALHLKAGRFLADTQYIQESVEAVRHLEAAGSPAEVVVVAKSIVGFLDLHGLWAEDEVVLQAALKAARQVGHKSDEGWSLNQLGTNHVRRGDTSGGIDCYEQALALAREMGDKRNEGTVIGNLAVALRRLGEVRKAIAYSEQALGVVREIGDRGGEGTALGNLGNAYFDIGELRQAIEYHEQALTIAREIGDRQREGTALGNLGLVYFGLGEMRKAIEYYEQALSIAREIGDRGSEGNQLGNLGLAHAALRQVRQAIEYYEQALSIFREIGDRSGEESALGNLGNAYASLGEVRQANEHYAQALSIAREIGDRRNEGVWLGNQGSAYFHLGDVKKTFEYCERALAIARETGDKRSEGNQLWNLGASYLELGDLRKAIEYYEQALAIAREIGDRSGEGNKLGNLGSAYFRLGDVKRAIEYYGQALAIAREIGDRQGEGNHLGNLGVLCSQQGDFEAAMRNLLPALAILREIESPDAGTVVGYIQDVQKKLGRRKFKALWDKVAGELGIQVSLEPPNAAK